jgi:hypothetical protein
MIGEARQRRASQGRMLPTAKRLSWVTWVLVVGGAFLAVYGTGHISTLGLSMWATGVLGQFIGGFALHRRSTRSRVDGGVAHP